MHEFIRVWQDLDIDDISSHLIIVGEATGDCSKCRELGLDYSKAVSCPKCGTSFKYVASRSRDTRRIKTRRSDLIFIDYDDYMRAVGKIKARGLFS